MSIEYFQRLIPNVPREIIDIDKKIKLDKNRQTETFSGAIGLAPTQEHKTLPRKRAASRGRAAGNWIC
jgi:hypothetical protein